jgi:hypothetical protein
MSNKFNSVKKEYWKRRRHHLYHRINFYSRWKDKNAVKNNIAPDVSTVTEKIAFVIDGKVVEVISCQPKLAAILLSEPIIVNAKNKDVHNGYDYIDGEFVPAKPEIQE